MLTIEQSALDLLLALLCAAAPWLARGLRSVPLAIGLAVGLALSLLSGFLALPLYPWSNLVVLLVALTAGLLVGRGMPPRFRPFLILLLILSALDVAQIALTGGLAPVPIATATHPNAAPSGPLVYLNFVLLLPGGHYLIGIFDLLVLTAVAEHWRRRGGSYLIAFMPGLLGFLLGDGAFWLTRLGGWPLLPFFTAGWLCSEATARVTSRRSGAAPAAKR
jgi:hypothetical protein